MLLIELFAYFVCAAFLSAQAIYWIWWFIGSPAIVDEMQMFCEAKRGRIFSRFGVWIAKKYSKLEESKYLEFLVENKNKNQDTPEYEPTHLNFWKIAGCCIYCFAVWAALILFGFWWLIAVKNLNYPSDAYFTTAFVWLFYTFLTLFFIKKEFPL